jgi:hypothetical protein
MSKKIIAVAAAAALALTGLVGVAPATALPVSGVSQLGDNSLMVTGSVNRSGSGTLASPYTVSVPDSGEATAATMMKFSISATASRAFTVTSTSGVKLLDKVADTTNKYTAASGAATLSGTTDASGAGVFYAFPTTTTAGIVTITIDTDITQVYVKGTAGRAYDIGTVTLPSLEPSKEGVIVAAVTDAFGNVLDSESNASLTVTRVGTGVTAAAKDVQYSATSKRWEGTVTAGATAGQLAVGLTIAGLTATDAMKTAFGAPNNTYFGVISVAAAKTVAELTTEITTLKSAVATLTVDYNKLAKKYNKLVKKSKRVALK